MAEQDPPAKRWTFGAVAITPFAVAGMFIPFVAAATRTSVGQPLSVGAWVFSGVIEGFLVAGLLYLWFPNRCWWAARLLAGVVFVLCVWYIIAAFTGLGIGKRNGGYMIGSIAAMIFIGRPAGLYAVLGRLTLRPEWSDAEDFADGQAELEEEGTEDAIERDSRA